VPAPARDLSDVVKSYDVRGLVPDELDEALARDLGTAFVRLLAAEAPLAGVVVGIDMRPSSRPLADALAAGVTAEGVPVVDVGLASTDLLYFASGHLRLPGAMVTASHNPAGYNGIKLCRAGAAPVGADSGLAEIRRELEAGVHPGTGSAPVTHASLLDAYARHLHSLVDLTGLRPLTVVVDAGNGMAGLTVPVVLGSRSPCAGTLTVRPLYFELDGSFPNHAANPLDAATLVDLQAAVQAEGADLGLAFDGDADRCFVVDETGAVVDPSALTAIVAVRELAREPGATVLHNLITSSVVPQTVRAHGGHPVRTRVGHSYIKAVMAETGAVFGGEHSGHFYFRDFWRADSGMLAAMHAIAALGATPPGTPFSSLVAPYARTARSGEINSVVPDAPAATARVHAALAGRPGVTTDELDGLTVSGADWWVNLRPSNTEPLLRLNVEAADQETMTALRDEVLSLVRGPEGSTP
jgi:phosphomannomutase